MFMIKGLIVSACFLILLGCSTSPSIYNQQHLAEINTELAILDLNQQHPENAKIHLLEAANLAPNDALVLTGEGFYDFKINELNEAAHFYQQALNVAPNNPEIENDYGVFLYQTHQAQQALPYFLKAAHNPMNLYAANAFQNAALAEQALGDSIDARQNFKEAQLLSPGDNGADGERLNWSDVPH